MKPHIRRRVSRLLRIIPRRRKRPAVEIQTPKITTTDEELLQERAQVALRGYAAEVATARQLANEVPEATPALRAILLAAARRRTRSFTQQ